MCWEEYVSERTGKGTVVRGGSDTWAGPGYVGITCLTAVQASQQGTRKPRGLPVQAVSEIHSRAEGRF